MEKHHVNRFAESHIPLIFKLLFCPCHGQDGIQVHSARTDNRGAAGKDVLAVLTKVMFFQDDTSDPAGMCLC